MLIILAILYGLTLPLGVLVIAYLTIKGTANELQLKSK